LLLKRSLSSPPYCLLLHVDVRIGALPLKKVKTGTGASQPHNHVASVIKFIFYIGTMLPDCDFSARGNQFAEAFSALFVVQL
jgi:hypothetical protein